jgi:hypothetical protein
VDSYEEVRPSCCRHAINTRLDVCCFILPHQFFRSFPQNLTDFYQVFRIAFAETDNCQVEEAGTTTPDSVQCVQLFLLPFSTFL